jgi:phage tail sheath gpL-like
MTINFNSLPPTLRIHMAGIEFDSSRALGTWQDINQNAFILGQMLAAGEAAPLNAIRVVSDLEADRLFGAGSMLAEMCRDFRKLNPYQQLYAMGIEDDVAGVQATGTITITGPAAAAGTLNLYIGGRRIRVAVENEDTATEVATAVAAAINADTSLPVTATSAVGVVTYTAQHKGVVGNFIDVRINYYHDDKTPSGLTVAIAATVVGTGNPDIGDALAALGDQHYWYMVCPYTDDANLTSLATELESRWSWAQAHYMLGFIASTGTQGEMAALGDTLNSPFLCLVGAGKTPTEPQRVAAMFGALAAYYLNNDPGRPLQGLKLTGMLPPALADRMPILNRNQLLFEGVSTYRVGDDGFCYAETAITTYQEDTLGAEDASWLWLNIPAQLAQYAYNEQALIFRTYPRHKLANDDFPVTAGLAVVRPKDIKALLISNYQTLMDMGEVEDLEGYKDDLVVERDASNPNRINVQEAPRLVGQFMQYFDQVQYRLGGSED